LFRQSARRDYQSVLDCVRSELLALVASQSPADVPPVFMRQ
jgi:hypothetical protein